MACITEWERYGSGCPICRAGFRGAPIRPVASAGTGTTNPLAHHAPVGMAAAMAAAGAPHAVLMPGPGIV